MISGDLGRPIRPAARRRIVSPVCLRVAPVCASRPPCVDGVVSRCVSPHDLSIYGEAAAAEQARTLLKQFGIATPKDLVLTTVSLRVRAPVSHFETIEYPLTSKDVKTAKKGKRTVFLNGEKGGCDVTVYDGNGLEHGHRIVGPALIETEHTTLLVTSGWTARVDQYTNTILEKVS